jgi:hypothetical protein
VFIIPTREKLVKEEDDRIQYIAKKNHILFWLYDIYFCTVKKTKTLVEPEVWWKQKKKRPKYSKEYK